ALANIVENIEREDLQPIQIAHAVRGLHEGYGLAMDTIAQRLKRSAAWLEQITELTRLPSEVQASIANGQTSANAGLALAAMDAKEAKAVFDAAKTSKGKVNATTVREAQRKRQEDKQESGKSTEGAKLTRSVKQLRAFLESRTGPADKGKRAQTATIILKW